MLMWQNRLPNAWARVMGVSAALCGIVLCGCQSTVTEKQAFIFGTLVQIKIVGVPPAQANQAIAAVFHLFEYQQTVFHPWKPGTVQALNVAIAHHQPFHVAQDVCTVLQQAQRDALRTQNLFNPAIGRLVEMWGFHRDIVVPRFPDPQSLRAMVNRQPRMSALSWLPTATGCWVRSTNDAVQIDLGGYVKGLALDRARDLLHHYGVVHAIINLGGNIMALGEKSPHHPWIVGIRDPRGEGVIAAVALHDGEAIGTSGDYQHYFTDATGRRYCHVIDPRTGYPANQVMSVTVLIPAGPQAGVQSDMATKPLFIVGEKLFSQQAKKMGITLALLVDIHHKVVVLPALQKRLLTKENEE